MNELNVKKIHAGFHIGLIAKSIFAVSETVSGLVMLTLTPERMTKLVRLISMEELKEDPTDLMMNYLVTMSHTFSLSTQQFTTFYLISHGSVKLLMIVLLWKKKRIAYPISCVMLLIFIALQVKRFMVTHSIAMVALTLLDMVMIVLTVLEYKNIKKGII